MAEETHDHQNPGPELLSVGHPERAQSCLARIRHLDSQPSIVGNDCMRKEVINLAREVLNILPAENRQRVDAQLFLSSSLSQLYEDHDDESIIEEAIQVGREAIPLCPRGHPYQARARGNLANSLKARFERTGEQHLIIESIDLLREALTMIATDDANRAFPCGSLANVLRLLHKESGNVALLTEAIDLQHEALKFCPEGHPHFPGRSESLASTLLLLHECNGEPHALAEAINIQRKMLNLRVSDPANRIFSCMGLASSLAALYIINGDEDILTEMISLQREALIICPEGHPLQPAIWNNLANTLSMRHERTGDINLLYEVINLQLKDVNSYPQGHHSRVASVSNLANSLCMLYQHIGDVNLLISALALKREALVMRPNGHPQRPGVCGTLANIMKLLHQHTNEITYLDEAIVMGREALALIPDDHPSRFIACENLANALQLRHKESVDTSHLDEAIPLLEEALSSAPPKTMWRSACGLAWAYSIKGTRFYDVDKAIHFLSISLEHEHDDLSQAVTAILTRIDDFWLDGSVHIYGHLIVMYQHLVLLVPLLANSAFDFRSQLQALRRCSRVGPDAFVCAALAGDLRSGLEMLEVLQGALWSQQLHLRDPQLSDVPDKLASELESLLRALSTRSAAQPMKSSFTTRDVLLNHNSRLRSLISEIRALPGLDRFMLGQPFEALCVATSRHPVIILAGARDHYYAFVLDSATAKRHEALTLDLTDYDMQGLAGVHASGPSTRGADGKDDDAENIVDERKFSLTRFHNPVSILHRSLKFIWMKIVKPVIDFLGHQPCAGRARPRVHWCPTGAFSSLPIHAAGDYDAPASQHLSAMSYVVSSYTPSISTLLRLQNSAAPISREDVSLALIAEKQAQGSGLPLIPAVEIEITDVATIATSRRIKVAQQLVGSTTVEDTYTAMQDTNIVHLACHGIQDTHDATQSGFQLGDGRLTITHLTKMKLERAFLAFLSACETAKGDSKQPDQVMHLAAAMLYCGFQNVVATMWAIADVDGPCIAMWFYEELFRSDVIDIDAVAYALDFAVGRLRESGVSTQRWVPFTHMGT